MMTCTEQSVKVLPLCVLKTSSLNLFSSKITDTDGCVYNVTVVDVSDSLTEAMRELEGIQDKRDTVLCSAMLLMYAHKKCKSVGTS